MRIETIGNATLYLGDCLEVMAGLPDASALRTRSGNAGYPYSQTKLPDISKCSPA